MTCPHQAGMRQREGSDLGLLIPNFELIHMKLLLLLINTELSPYDHQVR